MGIFNDLAALKEGQSKKDALPLLEQAEDYLLEVLNVLGYQPGNVPHHELFLHSTDDRLAFMEEKLQSNDPICAIPDAVSNARAVVDSFLRHYHIGYLDNFFCGSDGLFHIEINTFISHPSKSSLFSHTDRDLDAEFKEQMRVLELSGLVLNTCGYGGFAPAASAENIELLKTMFKELAINIDISLVVSERINNIDSVKLLVQPQNISKFKREPICCPIVPGPNLTQLEIEEIRSDSSEVLFAISSARGYHSSGDLAMSAMACNVAEHKFSEICKTFSYEGKITKSVSSRHKEEHDKNTKIRSISETLGTSLPLDENFYQVTTLAKNKLSTLFQKRLGMGRVSDFKVDGYGAVVADVRASSGFTPHALKRCKKTPLQFSPADPSKMLMNDSNMALVGSFLREHLPSATIRSVDSHYPELCSISLCISNANDIAKLQETSKEDWE